MKLPLEVGTRMKCRFRDGLLRPCTIIERRKLAEGEEYEYYVHYEKCEPACLIMPCRSDRYICAP